MNSILYNSTNHAFYHNINCKLAFEITEIDVVVIHMYTRHCTVLQNSKYRIINQKNEKRSIKLNLNV